MADVPPVDPKRREAEAAILAAIRAIRFGSVEVTVHDSAIVQVESKEKVRFNNPSSKCKC